MTFRSFRHCINYQAYHECEYAGEYSASSVARLQWVERYSIRREMGINDLRDCNMFRYERGVSLCMRSSLGIALTISSDFTCSHLFKVIGL